MRQDFLNMCIGKMKRQRNISLVFGVGMLLANVFLSIGVLHKTERVILVPPEINKTFWVSNKGIDETYLTEMSLFWSNILLNSVRGAGDFRTKIILDYVDPSFHGDLTKRLIAQEKYMSENDITTSFYPKEVKADVRGKKVILTGVLKNFISGDEMKKEIVSYELSFVNKGFRYLLNGFETLGEEEND